MKIFVKVENIEMEVHMPVVPRVGEELFLWEPEGAASTLVVVTHVRHCVCHMSMSKPKNAENFTYSAEVRAERI